MTEETLFELARKTPEAERPALLDRACEGNSELRARVEALLQADAASSPFSKPSSMQDATTGFQGTASYSSSDPVAGVIIAGRYSLEQKLGEGGMGEVWVARQSEPVKRKVALKLIKAGMDSKAVVQRFEQERQALAMMDHPNIAKVLDGGLTAQRQPFFVMELVNGLSLTKFCDEAKLGIKERLELFVPICQAVQHAHQKGIVHRDLKPANILVTIIDGKPVPKVIDFGVAKATGGKLTDESMSTQFGAVVGTLEYMSPEQAGFSGEDIDTRADIYSLGVILYEMLTGLRPIDAKRLKKAAFTEMIRIIQEEEPSKPSTRLSTDESLPSMAAVRQIEPKKLTNLLRGELDWVVMKCLEKQRDRRYETANGLARDVQRFLNDEVVEARPPSAGYRLMKYVRRHKAQILAASLIFLALVGGVIGTSIGMVQARRANAELADEQVKVQARFELAQKAIETFHTGVSEDALLKNESMRELRTKLLKEAAGFYADLEKLLSGQTDAKSRKALAANYYQLAQLTDKIGSKPEALAIHRKALDIRQELAANSSEPEAKTDISQSLLAVGLIYETTGKTDEALQTYEKARSTVAGADGSPPEASAARQAFASAEYYAGSILRTTGRMNDALRCLTRARDLQQALADAEPNDQNRHSTLGKTMSDIAILLFQTGKPADAIATYDEARKIQQRVVEAKPHDTRYLSLLALYHHNKGVMLHETGKFAEAMPSYEAGRELRQQLVNTNPVVSSFQNDLAISDSSIGLLTLKMGNPQKAVAIQQRALAIRKKLAAENPSITNYLNNLSGSYVNLGLAQYDLQLFPEALESYEASRKIRQQLADANPTVIMYQNNLARIHSNLGELFVALKRPEDALKSQEAALAIFQRQTNANPKIAPFQSDMAICYNNIGRLHLRLKRFAEALTAIDKGLDIRQKLADANPKSTNYFDSLGQSFACRGIARMRAGQPVEAAVDLRRALELWDKVPQLDVETRIEKSRALALLAALSKDAKNGVTAAEANSFADQSSATLHDAIRAGWKNLGVLNESEFDALRNRPDFQKLMKELDTKAQKPPEKK